MADRESCGFRPRESFCSQEPGREEEVAHIGARVTLALRREDLQMGTTSNAGRVHKTPTVGAAALRRRPTPPSAVLVLTQVDDPATLFLAVSNISQDELFAQFDGSRQSRETSVSPEYDSAGKIHECGFTSQFDLNDDRQLRTHSLRAPEVEPHSI